MGSFYVTKARNGKWRLMKETWANNKKSQKTIPVEAYKSLGLSPEATLEQAKARVKQLNAENKIEKMKMASAAQRVVEEEFYENTFFQAVDVDAFIKRLREKTMGSEAHLKRRLSQFRTIRSIIMELKVKPADYADNAFLFYRYLEKMRVSEDYGLKLLAMLNEWGLFVARSQKTFFEPIPMPPQRMRAIWSSAQKKKKGVRRAGGRLDRDKLIALRSELPALEYNWLHCSLWLGLRPEEVDRAAKEGPEILTNSATGLRVLKVLQTKILEAVGEDSAYKYIPLLFTEQDLAVTYLTKGEVKRPKRRAVKDATGTHYELNAGRKGFVDLMQSLGQQLDHASIWMGHKDIRTTVIHYKDPTNVPFTPISPEPKKGA